MNQVPSHQPLPVSMATSVTLTLAILKLKATKLHLIHTCPYSATKYSNENICQIFHLCLDKGVRSQVREAVVNPFWTPHHLRTLPKSFVTQGKFRQPQRTADSNCCLALAVPQHHGGTCQPLLLLSVGPPFVQQVLQNCYSVCYCQMNRWRYKI